MFKKLVCVGLLAAAWMVAADGPEWVPIDEYSVAGARAQFGENQEKPPVVSAVPVFAHGLQADRRNRLEFSVVNTSASDARVLLEFVDGMGKAVSVPTTKGTAAGIVATLTSGGQLTESLPNFDNFVSGWIRITTDAQSGASAQAKLSVDDSSIRFSAAPAAKLRAVMQLEEGDAFLAMVNPSQDGVSSVRLSAMDEAGSESCSADLELASNSQLHGELATWLPCVHTNVKSVKIESTQGEIVGAAYGIRDGKFNGTIPLNELPEANRNSPELMVACNPYFSDDVSPLFNAAGGSTYIYVHAGYGCRWSISGAVSGITVSKQSGTGAERIQVTAGNWSPAGGRQVFLQVGRSRYQVRQQGVRCSFSLNSDILQFGSGGGSKAFAVQSNCFWEVKESTYFISVNEKFGFGNMGAIVSVSSFPRVRNATIIVGDKRLYVQQSPSFR